MKGEIMGNERVGMWYYYDQGTDIVIDKEQYEHGKLSGSTFGYYSDGSKRYKGKYKENIRVGDWDFFYKGSGAQWIRLHYDANGNITGELLIYFENGELKRREVHDNGRLVEYKCYGSWGQDTVYTPFEAKAKFDGEVSTFIGKELKYPTISRMQGVEGKVKVEFVVNKDGSISGATIVEGLNSECDEEALRIVNAMPKWIPAHTDGQPFRSTVSVPIVFWIPENTNGM